MQPRGGVYSPFENGLERVSIESSIRQVTSNKVFPSFFVVPGGFRLDGSFGPSKKGSIGNSLLYSPFKKGLKGFQ